MPRPLSIAIIASLLFTSVVMADDKPSPAVKRILDKTVAEVKKNLVDFSKKSEKPLGDARLELQELSKKLIEDGKTVDATAVLKQIETLEADVMRMAKAPAPGAGGGAGKPAPQKPLLERLVGKWERTEHPEYLTMNPNGIATLNRDSDHATTVKGNCVPIADAIEIKWSNGFRWELRMAGDETVAVYEWRPDGNRFGQGIALERMK